MRRTVLAILALSGSWIAACGGAQTSVPTTPSPGPALVVERFLQAANANDLETMMELFGTAERSIAELDGRSKAERRMHVLASLLRHSDFSIQSQAGVPGRLGEAVQLQVRLVRGAKAVIVPHVVVERDSGGWIIERIDIEPLTQKG